MTKSIQLDTIKSFQKKFAKNTSYSTMQRAVTNNGISAVSDNNFASATNTTVFSLELATSKVTDQNQSGRCWLFATLNVLRHQIEEDYKIEHLELSESYSFFWDKLEKSNLFYEQILASAKLPIDSREVEYLLDGPQGDGGWWEMSVSIIEKYGIVPQNVMPESETTTNSAQLNTLLNRKLRKDALRLRALVEAGTSDEGISKVKTEMTEDVYRFLSIAIGTPPESFQFSYRDKDKKYHSEQNLTPLSFLKKYTRNNLNEFVSIINDPTPSKEYGQTYIIDGANNVVEGNPVMFLNADIKTLKELALKQLQAKQFVWIGLDVRHDTNKKGFMTTDVHDFEGTFDVDFKMTKAERLLSRDSNISHAMVLTGVDVHDGEAKQWKVENSWGEDRGEKGFYTMSNDWMDEHAYEVVIRKDMLSPTILEELKKDPIVLPRWDPVNSLSV